MLTPTGTLLNERYRLDGEIGRGGMGVVFQGWDTLLQRKVAIKILNQETLGGGGTGRLLEEARVIARLDHPNIVILYDAGQEDGNPFLVMQLVEGSRLSDEDSLDLNKIIAIGIQICSALTHAHENGIVHRDLKPDNIFLAGYPHGGEGIQNQRVRIVDFGIAHSDLASMTIQGEIAGTVSYMAPEQALGQETSPQTDLYALGVILYELSTGKLPFTGENPLNVISQHINVQAEPPSRINSVIPDILDKIILRLMNKAPGDRPASALEVGETLSGLLRAEGYFDPGSIAAHARGVIEHNLPEQLTSFVGRRQEIEEISDLIAQDSCRLLTLAGPGGIGKTRLAIEAAAQNIDNYKDGVFFVSLASISGPDFILPSIAEALEITLQTHGSTDPESQLFDYLANRSTLLLMDNYEHLMNGSGMLVELLKRAPGVKLMVTSRQRLNVEGEWTYNLGGMAVPGDGYQEGEIDGSAVELFFERARLANAHFSIQWDDQHVIRICRLVAGIPLGIELAAAWVSMLSPQEIAGEIEKNLDFLASTRQGMPDRHRSMRAAFDYSWEMLSGDQRQIFKRLSVFRGGFSRQAAAEVAECGLVDLSVLVDKSFIRRVKDDRYEIHELLREYGEEKLHEKVEDHREIGNRHSQYYLDFINLRESKITGEMQIEARDAIQPEIENIRAAIRWGAADGDEQTVHTALQVLSDFYFMWGYYAGVESFKNFAKFFQDQCHSGVDAEKPGSLMLMTALTYQAYFLSMLGAVEEADEIARKVLPDLRELNILQELRVCLMSLGINASFRGDYKKAEQDFKTGLEIAKNSQHLFGIVGAKIWLGWAYYEQGANEEALKEWLDGQDTAIKIKNRLILAFVQSKLALLGEETGDYENAIKIQLQARENFEHFGDQVGVGYATSRLALSLMGIGEYREAKRFGQQALQCFRNMNHRWGIPASLCRIGFAEIELSEYEAAWAHLNEALDLAKKGQIGTLVLYSLIGLSQLLAENNQVEQGVKNLSFVISNPITPSLYREMAGQRIGELEKKLPPDKFYAAKAAGEKAQIEEIIESLPPNLEGSQKV